MWMWMWMLGRVGGSTRALALHDGFPGGEKRVANGDWPSPTSAWVMHQMRLVAVVDDDSEQVDSIGITMRQERREKREKRNEKWEERKEKWEMRDERCGWKCSSRGRSWTRFGMKCVKGRQKPRQAWQVVHASVQHLLQGTDKYCRSRRYSVEYSRRIEIKNTKPIDPQTNKPTNHTVPSRERGKKKMDNGKRKKEQRKTERGKRDTEEKNGTTTVLWCGPWCALFPSWFYRWIIVISSSMLVSDRMRWDEMRWDGMGWYGIGMVRHGMVWYGIVWYRIVSAVMRSGCTSAWVDWCKQPRSPGCAVWLLYSRRDIHRPRTEVLVLCHLIHFDLLGPR